MTQKFLISSEFMGKTAEFAVGCAAVATGMVVAPWAAPALGVAAVLGAAGLSKLIRQKPDCVAAVAQIVKTTSREFSTAHDADETAVRAAEKALGAALDVDGLFSVERLRDAWAKSDRVAEGLADLALESIAARDASFAEPGLRRDLARDVLDRAFGAAVVACSAFREIATLTGVEAVATGVRGAQDQLSRIERMLQDKAGLSDEQVRRVLGRFGQTLDDQPIDGSGYEARLLALADQFVQQVTQAEAPTNDAPDVAAKRRAAAAALKDSEFERAEALFAEIAEIYLETGRRDVLAASSAIAEQGGAARLRGDLLEAAGHFGRAAEMSAPFDAETAWRQRFVQADILDDHGQLFPGPALDDAVRIWRDHCLPHAPRDTQPIKWAMLQNNMGITLKTLGSRLGGEAGVRALADSVTAFEAALMVYTRADKPTDWAMTKNNVGIALRAIGDRTGGEAGIQFLTEAVAAYEAALEVHTRDARPVDWAMTQTNLGAVLLTLGARSGGEAGLKALADAAVAYDAVLEMRARADGPVEWAMAQNNRGAVLKALGTRSEGEAGIKALTDAVQAYALALEVYTRPEMPIDWATTQNNLGNALTSLGSRMEGEAATAALTDSIRAHEAALEVRTRVDMPAQWTMTTANLCIAQGALARHLGEAARACEAADRMVEVIVEFKAMQADAWVERAERIRAGLIETCRDLGGDCAA